MANTKVRKPWQSGQYTVYLWEFLFGLLQDPECCSLITWTNKENKEFRIKNTHEIATLWGTVKNRPTMDDKKLLRALRYYYKTKVLRKVKGHKGVYQFLSIPYETEKCEQRVKTSGEPGATPPPVASPESSSTDISEITSDCSERLQDDCEMAANHLATAVDGQKCTENVRAVDNLDQEENDFDQTYRSRESSSEYSLTSESSSKSLEELQEDFLGINVLDHMGENMDFVFNNDNNVRMLENGDVLN